MGEFLRLLAHPHFLGGHIFFLAAALMVWIPWTNSAPPKIKILRALQLLMFGLAITWGMQQQYHVLNGAVFASQEAPVEILIRGVTRYVSTRQAWLYHLSLFPALALGLLFALIERAFIRQCDEA